MRTAKFERNTKETKISLKLNLDGGEVNVSTGIGFFDHMLTAFAVHGGFGLEVVASGDLEVDTHHTAEDVGIVLGNAFNEALGDMSGINRYGSFSIPMDDSLAQVSLDISNRPFLVYNVSPAQEKCGDFESCCAEEFWRAFAMNSKITLHINVPYGNNAHHQLEAEFKAVAHALKIALSKNGDGSLLSTKGVL